MAFTDKKHSTCGLEYSCRKNNAVGVIFDNEDWEVTQKNETVLKETVSAEYLALTLNNTEWDKFETSGHSDIRVVLSLVKGKGNEFHSNCLVTFRLRAVQLPKAKEYFKKNLKEEVYLKFLIEEFFDF